MRWIDKMSLRIRSLFSRASVEQELDAELHFHLQQQIEENLAAGMSAEEARYAARRAIGGADQIKDDCRDMRRVNLVQDLLQDLRYAARILRKSPAFTAAAVLTLALSIGANTAIFSVVNAALLRPLPFRNPDRLVMVWEDLSFMGFPQNTPAPANFVDWKYRNHVFTDMAAMHGDLMSLTGDGQPEEVEVKIVTANFFSLMGIRPVVGRTFLPDEDRSGAAHVALLSRGIWVRRYGGNRQIVGNTVLLSGEKYTVIGVLPPGFDFPDPVDVWVPMAFSAEQWRQRSNHFLEVVARLRDGVTVERARVEMIAIAKRLEHEYPETNTRVGSVVVPLHDQFVGGLRLGFIVLLATVAGVLLIACANIANLLLARATGRQREMAMRIALGARRSRLVRQVLTESVFLASLGGLVGVLLASWTFGFLTRLIPLPLASTAAVSLSGPVLLFSVAVAMAAGILFGLAPACNISGGAIAETLKQNGRGAVGTGGGRLRSALVVVEVSLAVTLLIGTGLMLQTLFHLQEIDPGFRPGHVLCLRTSLSATEKSKYRDLKTRVEFYQRVLAGVTTLPGVVAAGYTTYLPFTNGGGTSGFAIEGKSTPRGGPYNDANHRVITPDYLRTIGARLIAGRSIQESDRSDSLPVALINQTMAQKYWLGEDPIGKRFKLGDDSSPTPWITIVGVVGDIRQLSIDVPARPEMYFSYQQQAANFGFYTPRDLAVRIAGDPLTLAPAIRRVIADVDKDQPVSKVQPMQALLASEIADRRLQLQLLGSFAVLALILVSVGIYGVLAYAVKQCTPEIGVRMALGARQQDILRSVMGGGARLICTGLTFGLAGAWVLTRLIRSLLYGITAADPATFIGSTLLFLLIGLAACYFPARRASRVDPTSALRYE
jgi:predicted permease